MKIRETNPKHILLLSVIFGALFYFGCNHAPEKVSTKSTTNKIQVGVFSGSGASTICIMETLEALKLDSGICGRRVSPIDIQLGVLDSMDVLIFPGGSGSKEYNGLGQTSASIVQQFAKKQGKGVVGICAGGFLFATTEGYPSLEIIRAKTIRDHYNRGRGLISIGLSNDGKKIFPELAEFDTLFVQYYDGPIYEILDSAKINVTAQINSDIATHKNDPKGVTPDKPAFLTTNYGQGKVFVSVGHPESTPGMRWMVPRMARWTVDKPLISYGKSVVRPEINTHEILYYPDVIKFEKENFWNLFGDNNSEIIDAIDNLNSIRSRPSIRWTIGLLDNYFGGCFICKIVLTPALPLPCPPLRFGRWKREGSATAPASAAACAVASSPFDRRESVRSEASPYGWKGGSR
ncbi:MAG: biofilm PGA synthesis protein PgaB [Bacteroidetes bacterium 4572_114]|nr:MAG: biofilm PGA synthesis protein PgaB [Bacteroidetes bacterium 4572_114]